LMDFPKPWLALASRGAIWASSTRHETIFHWRFFL
jgi:hypothetical protein